MLLIINFQIGFLGQFRNLRRGLKVDILEECNTKKLCKHPNKECLKILNCSKVDIWTKFGTLRRGSSFKILMKIKILNCF